MSRQRKGIVGLFGLALASVITVVLFSIFLGVNDIIGLWKIKGNVELFMELDDKGSQSLGFLDVKKGDLNHMAILGAYEAVNVPSEYENSIVETLGKLGQYHLIFQDESNVIKEFKSSAPPTGGTSVRGQIKLEWPVKNYDTISSGYGWRTLKDKDGNDFNDFHGGVDFAVPEGTNVYSAYPTGKVISVEDNCEPSPIGCSHVTKCSLSDDKFCCCNGGLGNYIVIEHLSSSGEIFYTHYDHLNIVIAKPKKIIGKDINPKGAIATSGKTGYVKGVTGEHLHFEVSKAKAKSDDASINPCTLFPEPVPAQCSQESHRPATIDVVVPMPGGKTGYMGLIS